MSAPSTNCGPELLGMVDAAAESSNCCCFCWLPSMSPPPLPPHTCDHSGARVSSQPAGHHLAMSDLRG